MTDSKQSKSKIRKYLAWGFGVLLFLICFSSLGYEGYKRNSPNAKYFRATETLKTMATGFENYRSTHNSYPEFPDFASMINQSSPLVRENFIPLIIYEKDPWGNPFRGHSSKNSFTLECVGDPSNQTKFPPLKLGTPKP